MPNSAEDAHSQLHLVADWHLPERQGSSERDCEQAARICQAAQHSTAPETLAAERHMCAQVVWADRRRAAEESGATRYDTITIGELKDVLSGGGTKAGEYKLFDPVAIRVVERSKIPTIIFDGREPENLTKVFGDSTIGTVIVHEE